MTGYGYYTQFGYKGRVDGVWMIFSTEDEYEEYLKEYDKCS